MIKNTLAVAWKDLQVLFRDRAQLIILFVSPLMFGLLFGGIGSADPKFTVYLVNDDPGQYGAQVVNALSQVEVLSVEKLATVQEADQKVADGEAATAIIIPADFSQNVDAFDPVNDPARIQVIMDPAQQWQGGMVTGVVNDILTWVNMQGEIQHGIRTVMDESGLFDALDEQTRRGLAAQSLGATMTQLQKASTDPLINVQSEDLKGIETQLPNNGFGQAGTRYTVMFAFFIVATISGTLLAEKEQGTFRRLLASPLHRGSIILGKMLAYMLVVCLQVVLVFAVGRALFDMPLGNSPLGLVLVTLALALAATSLGMLVATVARSRGQAMTISTILGIVLAVLGGVMTGVPTQGSALYWPSRLTPHAHAITAYFKLMAGAGVVDILPQLGLLVGVGVLFFLIAMWRFKFE
jgi:ABC-2 type transport system permease protein